ncbi:MAG: hypothetical protein HWN80_19245 [Candidatus Lokiarchaeota archaeon]|nr:hypothetical protein [Candidatus Lokiarchaeota archaeon]
MRVELSGEVFSCHSQQRECVALERGVRGSGLEWIRLKCKLADDTRLFRD